MKFKICALTILTFVISISGKLLKRQFYIKLIRLHSLRTVGLSSSSSALQGEGGDGGPGGESTAAADGDYSGDAGGPAGGERGSREEDAGGLGRCANFSRTIAERDLLSGCTFVLVKGGS